MALGRLVESEMEEEDDEQDSDGDYAPGLLDKLLDVLQNDTNAEVRRALLVNLPATPKTLPYLLERARDRDGPTRRALYAKLLPKLGDFRHLSLSMREKLLRWGLRDRDERVRNAAARVFREHWIENCAATEIPKSVEDRDETGAEEEAGEKKEKLGFYEPNINALLELLERIDTLNNGNEDGVALEAMKEFWAGRQDYLDAVTFDDDFWDHLTSESAFMARTFNDYCQSDPKYHGLVEEKMPEVTRLGFHLQKHINELTSRVQAATEAGTDETMALQTEQEFIVEQLLYIAQSLDYTDEIGRRKMFSLLRHALSMADLPEDCTRLAVEALRLVCNPDAAGEREFTAVVLEAIAEVHDNIASSDLEDEADNDDEDSFVSARSEVSSDSTPKQTQTKTKKNKTPLTEEEQEARAVKEIVINMKCLHIAQCMLQNVAGNLQSNIDLRTMFDNLVIPAVRSHESLIRERGVQCLGLCCLLEPKLADENMRLFTHLLKKGHETLQVIALQILCDIVLARGPPSPTPASLEDPQTSPNTSNEGEAVAATNSTKALTSLLSPFVKALSATFPEDVRLVSTTSLCKFMLCGFYTGNEVLFDQIVERAVGVTAKGWELLEKVKNAVQVEGKNRDKQDGKEGAKTPRKSHAGTASARSSNDGVGNAGERLSGEGMEL
jgi:condensin complex subunit 3